MCCSRLYPLPFRKWTKKETFLTRLRFWKLFGISFVFGIIRELFLRLVFRASFVFVSRRHFEFVTTGTSISGYQFLHTVPPSRPLTFAIDPSTYKRSFRLSVSSYGWAAARGRHSQSAERPSDIPGRKSEKARRNCKFLFFSSIMHERASDRREYVRMSDPFPNVPWLGFLTFVYQRNTFANLIFF